MWTLAALNITGLLEPTLGALDSVAVTFGELRVSLLTVIKGVLSATVLLWAASALSRLLETRIKRVPDLSPSIQVLMGKLLKITLLTIAVIIAMKSVGIDLTALALFSGAIGLGIGFGLQKVVSNIISGVILLLDKSIKPGDVIELGETFGWISSLGARYVSVVTRDGKEYLIPNEDLITQRVVNWSFSNQFVRLEIPVGVSYESIRTRCASCWSRPPPARPGCSATRCRCVTSSASATVPWISCCVSGSATPKKASSMSRERCSWRSGMPSKRPVSRFRIRIGKFCCRTPYASTH